MSNRSRFRTLADAQGHVDALASLANHTRAIGRPETPPMPMTAQTIPMAMHHDERRRAATGRGDRPTRFKA